MTKEKKEKSNRRSRTKYPALDSSKNLPSRKEYIEPLYINGVVNEEGEVVIRALNEDEKAFINQYYEETVVTNFLHDPELKRLNQIRKSIIEDDGIKRMKEQLTDLKKSSDKSAKERIRELSEIIRLTKKQNEEIYCDELRKIESQMKRRRKEVLLYPDKEDHKIFYNENNARNSCILNRSKSGYKLEYFDVYETDRVLDLIHKSSFLDENDIIDAIERPHWESLEEHLAEAKKEEVQSQKLTNRDKNRKD